MGGCSETYVTLPGSKGAGFFLTVHTTWCFTSSSRESEEARSHLIPELSIVTWVEPCPGTWWEVSIPAAWHEGVDKEQGVPLVNLANNQVKYIKKKKWKQRSRHPRRPKERLKDRRKVSSMSHLHWTALRTLGLPTWLAYRQCLYWDRTKARRRPHSPLPNPISKTRSEGLNTQAVVRYQLSHLVNIPHKQEGKHLPEKFSKARKRKSDLISL